jgi:hypothetical protein
MKLRRSLLTLTTATIMAVTLAKAAQSAGAAEPPSSTPGALATGAPSSTAQPPAGVGLTGLIQDLLLPGSELQVKPDPEGRSPVVVRMTAVRPNGTAGFRYDFSWFAYEAGPHDLSQYLERVDGSPLGAMPAIGVEAVAVLPPGPPQTLPEFQAPLPKLGGYRTALVAGGCLWLAGWVALFIWRRPHSSTATAVAPDAVRPLAERLRFLLESARTGSLDADGRAQLERHVLGLWRERLHLTDLPVPEAVHRLRNHPEAGGLLREVESWLHSGKSTASETHMAALLLPYLPPAGATAPPPVGNPAS